MFDCKISYLNNSDGIRKLKQVAYKMVESYHNQKKLAVELIEVCKNPEARYSWDRFYKTMYLIVDTEQPLGNRDDMEYTVVESLIAYEKENNISIDTVNKSYLMEHKAEWLISFESACTQTFKGDNKVTMVGIEVDENNNGLYGYYSKHGVLKFLVNIESFDNLVKLMDAHNILPSTYTINELVDLGYLTKDDHMSWLGSSGTKVHAVVAYFRKFPNENVYYRLDTWCGGNPWTAQEHSPIPKYPNLNDCTCLKCKKIIEKKLAKQN